MPGLTRRRRHGDAAETAAVRFLESLGWRVLARNIVVGRDEIDIVALDPGPPAEIACVEVRSNATSRFGAPEESVVGRKVRRLYRSMAALRSDLALSGGGVWPAGGTLPRRITWRVDLVTVEMAPSLGPSSGGPRIRHLRRVDPA
ncbi:MAG: YraN family protein [Chloroflexi bacterium]|nr:YraN family protein [Chloroflexota bacterium]